MPSRYPPSIANLLRDMRERLYRNLEIAVDSNTALLQKQHQDAVRNWKDKPKFTRILIRDDKGIYGRVLAGGGESVQHWFWTDEGTKAHTIAAKNAPTLKFQTGFRAKTLPIARSNAGSGKATGAWRSPIVVQHPGTDKRLFRRTWIKAIRPAYLNSIRVAIKRP